MLGMTSQTISGEIEGWVEMCVCFMQYTPVRTNAHMHTCTNLHTHTHTREPSSTKQLMCQPSRVQSVYTLWSSWLKIIGLHIAVVTQCLLCSLPNVCRLQRQLFSLKLVMRNQLHASHDQGCWSRHQGFGTPKKCQFGMKVDKK